MIDDRAFQAAFCRTLPELEHALRRRGESAAYDAAVAAVRAGTPVLEVLPGLGIPPHVLLVPEDSREVTPGGVVRGLSRVAAGEAYRCPHGACAREVVREPGGPVPAERCWLWDAPLAVGEA